MKVHAREKDTAAWLAQEYGGSNSNSLFVVRAGSPEETQLPWPRVQRRIAQLIQEDRFYTCLLYTSYFGIETGENSFGYIASWSQGKELKELRASLETINKTSGTLKIGRAHV